MTFLVTGATSGLGLAVAGELAARGARVVLCGRDRGRSEAVLAMLHAQHPQAELELELADLSTQHDVRRLATAVRARHPRLAGVVNAGPGFAGFEGAYISRGRVAEPAPVAGDDALAAELWRTTEALVLSSTSA